MKRLLLIEDEKNDILSKYQDDTDNKIMIHLRRNYPVIKLDLEFLNNKNAVMVDDKVYLVKDNKKTLVNKIYLDIIDIFPDVEEKVIRRTIKKYLDLILFS